MAKTNFSLFCNRTGDSESFKTFADSGSAVSSVFESSFYSDSCAENVSPNSVVKADGLNAFDDFITVNAFFINDMFFVIINYLSKKSYDILYPLAVSKTRKAVTIIINNACDDVLINKEVAENIENVISLPGGAYNFGSETTKSMYEITKDFLKLIGKRYFKG